MNAASFEFKRKQELKSICEPEVVICVATLLSEGSRNSCLTDAVALTLRQPTDWAASQHPTQELGCRLSLGLSTPYYVETQVVLSPPLTGVSIIMNCASTILITTSRCFQATIILKHLFMFNSSMSISYYL